jgi:hypothetical protein
MVMKWLRRVWNERRRSIDAKILWPSIREQAATLEDAHDAYRMHMLIDDAYSDLSLPECEEFLRSLPR